MTRANRSTRLLRILKALLRDDSAQATTEYVLLLSIVTAFVLILANKLIKPVLGKAMESIAKKMDDAMFSGDLHQLRIRR